MAETYDFSGWATRNDLKCADGRTIRRNAFKDCDGKTVPLVWQHMHDSPENVLGHALLENREDGVYTYGKFNDTEAGRNAKLLVEHGDIKSLSIYANKLKQSGGDVLHGVIREVSLVLAGANIGAFIDHPVLAHGEEVDDEAIIYEDEESADLITDNQKGEPEEMVVRHTEEEPKEEPKEEVQEKELSHAEEENAGDKTVGDIIATMTEEQKQAMYYLIGNVIKDAQGGDENDEGEEEMKHNVFDAEPETKENTLSHELMTNIIKDAKKMGSMREAALAHADDEGDTPVTVTYGIEHVDYLFPDYKNYNEKPPFISRKMDWVPTVMGGVHHTPFSRVKSMFADITADEARAKGYFKGNLKKNEVFTLLKRHTDPQTIYKKQKMDRDDVIDITDFDVVAWLKGEMRMMLDEEIARAILVGDGRDGASDDKISEDHIRSIWKDEELYTIHQAVTPAAGQTKAKAFILAAIRARKDYRGSGNPVLFTTEDMLTEMLLEEDGFGHFLYQNESALATTLRVSRIVTVPVMEEITDYRVKNNVNYVPLGIIVNLNDYNVGADKGGSVNMFEDFDIDYNQQKYLIETRCSGALVKPKAAIALEEVANP